MHTLFVKPLRLDETETYMIKKSIIGLILACAACCTLPFLIPALAGVSVLGFSLFGTKLTLDSILCGLALAGLASVILYFIVKAFLPKKAAACGKNSCASNGSCGCK
jgi:ABC-type uncharacterized transport system permease subunit